MKNHHKQYQDVLCFNLNLLECKSTLIVVSSIHSCVLISTYWNVNPNKLKNDTVHQWRFNLNLLECKWSMAALKHLFQVVLISTYWNVNCFANMIKGTLKGFNLNLLECKWHNKWGLFKIMLVLISTYWNVNLNNTVTNEHIYIVLISTYWNVNDFEYQPVTQPTTF